MAAEELLRKIRELEEGQAELKREISKLVPERRAQSPSSSSRRPPPAQRALAALPQSSSRMQRVGRVGFTDRQHIRALHALGQSVYVISPMGSSCIGIIDEETTSSKYNTFHGCNCISRTTLYCYRISPTREFVPFTSKEHCQAGSKTASPHGC